MFNSINAAVRSRLRAPLLRIVTAARNQLLDWQADAEGYTNRGTEPVLEVLRPGTCWKISGRHGAVLVSTNLPIWDIDGIDPEMDDETALQILQRRLGRAIQADPGFEVMTEVCRLRVYRTYSGFRVICPNRPINLRDAEDWGWFAAHGKALGADPIYMRCCQRQFTCRARLEPKPERLESLGLAAADARSCRLISEDLSECEFVAEDISDLPELTAQVEAHDWLSGALHDHHLRLA